MRTSKAILLLFILCLFTAQAFSQSTAKAQELVRAGIEAMGGEAKLSALKSLKFEGIGHNYWVEQSERPEGPFLVGYSQGTELRDLAKNRIRTLTQMRHAQAPQWTPGFNTIVADGVAAMERDGKYFPGMVNTVDTEMQKLAFGSERILLSALAASDLRVGKDEVLQSVSHHSVKFTLNKTPVTVYLNSTTKLPTAVETVFVSPYDLWAVWGDNIERVYYSFWTLEQGGIRYPRQRDVMRNGYTASTYTILKIEVNAPVAEESFSIPDDIKQKFAAQPKPKKITEATFGRADRPANEIAPGIVKVSGSWDICYIKQPDGIVIIEAPLTSGYSVMAIDEVKKRFPGEKIKGVISTSDAFPHLGGVREYAAQNIPIYALDVNRPILERILAAPHTIEPDALQKDPRKAVMKYISGKIVLGEGPNRLELYPIRSESGERMIMIYFPQHQMLYASDLIQKNRDGSYFMPQYLSEVVDAAVREKLTVKNVFAMHAEITPWSDIVNAVEKLKN